jgi:hypothetical protein
MKGRLELTREVTPLLWSAPRLGHKYLARVEVNQSDEHSSLLQYNNKLFQEQNVSLMNNIAVN